MPGDELTLKVSRALLAALGLTLFLAPVGVSARVAVRRAAVPAHGWPASTFVVHYHARGEYARGRSSFLYDEVYLYGPRHTRCARVLAHGSGVRRHRLGTLVFALGPDGALRIHTKRGLRTIASGRVVSARAA